MRLPATVSIFALLAAAPALAQTGTGNPATMAPGTPQSAPGMPAPNQVNQNDRLFVYELTIGGNAEVASGQLAEQKGGFPAIRDFGHQMAADHSKANQQLMQLTKAANLPQPGEPDEENKAMRSQLDRSNGADFDLAYIRGQVADHQKTAQLLEWEIGSGQDPQLKAFASEILPVVLRHLQMAENIESQLTATASAPNPPRGAPTPAVRPAPR
jgi:putative membrane protein